MPLSPAFDAGRFAILELIARGRALPDVLDRIVRLIEAERHGLIASILLVDLEARCLRDGAAPSLPIAYTRLLDGLPIGPKNGSCGTAAYLGEPVIVEDISTHPYWEDFAQLALPHGLRACWSTPIRAADGTVLGTFAVYYLKPRGPRESEVGLVAAATDLAAVAIGRDRVERSVRRSEARYRQIIDGAHEGIWTTDTSHRTTFANRRMGEILGEPAAALPGRSLLEFVHPDDKRRLEQSLSSRNTGRSDEVEFRVCGKDGSERWVVSSVTAITNEFGEVAGAVGFVRDVRERRASSVSHLIGN
jgi:PAS domain S-box-containing protein